MRKILLWTVLAVAAVLSACSGGNSKGTTKIKIDDFGWVVVDTFTANHYADYQIRDALMREEFVRKVTKPTDASSFGKKIAEREWRAFNANLVEKGTVTTVEYERGFEVIKNGKHWFYDIENMDESDLQFRMEVGAAESVLHPGVWEPVWIDRTMLNNIAFYFIYRCGWEGIEGFYISEREQAKLKIYDGGDARLSTRNFN